MVECAGLIAINTHSSFSFCADIFVHNGPSLFPFAGAKESTFSSSVVCFADIIFDM